MVVELSSRPATGWPALCREAVHVPGKPGEIPARMTNGRPTWQGRPSNLQMRRRSVPGAAHHLVVDLDQSPDPRLDPGDLAGFRGIHLPPGAAAQVSGQRVGQGVELPGV